MLKLRTPLVLGSHTYDILIPGRGEWDLRARRVEFFLVPAQEEPERLRLGKEIESAEGRQIVAPPVVLTLQLQDASDPRINTVLQAFTAAFESIEELIAPALAEQGFQFGEDVLPLAADFVTSEKEYRNARIGLEKEKT